ncbi:unnamed protein product [Tuber melanosporum]|uniref:(Perigord truffle) hypothetical protein n=1 Tax=Tuber melanosporum (strain Mel28) TaxID=656061 RepID=D5GES4_TUBMM|nr:uncharacterized protein GSTUM_00006584001 [Tuber melanosporum]CAZ83017.1 unnamed protein product [Tuber melanosporum]
MLAISPTEHDIGLYVGDRLSKEFESGEMDEELAADIHRIIPVISEIFLLVSQFGRGARRADHSPTEAST